MSEIQFLKTLSRYHRDIREGNVKFDYRTGACGPVQATSLRSWGAGCPPGNCSAADLPPALARYFAGDRAGCREMPYTITGEVDDAESVTMRGTSIVTMCPTRVIARSTDALGNWLIHQIKFGNQNQLVGGPIPASALDRNAFQSVPLVFDCLRAGQPYEIVAEETVAPETLARLSLIFIGPMVG